MPTFVTDDDVTLSYLDEGSGPVVVLVAGFGAPATTWVFQQDALVRAGYRVLALDRRGHGDSEAPDHGATMARHGRDLDNFLTAVGVETAVLMGGSMGASTVWSYIRTTGTSRVRGVVSVDQTPKMINDASWPHGFYGLTDATVDGFFAKGIPATGHGPSTFASLLPVAKLILRLRSMPRMVSSETPPMRALLDDHARQDWRADIRAADVPILMIAGRNSQFWPSDHAVVTARDTAQGQVALIDSGHAANMDRPREVNEVVLTFLRGIGY
ncbi:alpha/beta hydrolase [Rhodococcus sp. BP-316]|uniref:alpha/beta fold hydrolase n=1 Tax=Rhodococcus sp. BP-316 TaxID=2739445 RepID=UPI001C9AA817|nr:alpha/beta hydrolase [Rhodococcus sp. BP-316]MBY6682397.1 alpha/beta hydrolase [Rhodococcus sp. BP-316]